MSLMSRQENLRAVPTAELHTRIIHEYTTPEPWARSHQQKMFNLAHELIRRPNKNRHQERDAGEVLWTLAHFYHRTWTIHPLSNRFSGYINSNSNANSPSPAAVQAPNYSKASVAVKKWLSTRPHTIHMNVVNIKLPALAQDPVSYHNFKPGNEAVMVIKKRIAANGAVRSKRTFYQKNIIERLAGGKKWRTILRMKGPEVVFRDPINRRSVYRRDLMNVKFRS